MSPALAKVFTHRFLGCRPEFFAGDQEGYLCPCGQAWMWWAETGWLKTSEVRGKLFPQHEEEVFDDW